MKTIKYPSGVQFEITPNCNHNCIHCYNYWRTGEEAATAVDPSIDLTSIAEKIAELKPTHVTITGGEPLVRFEDMKRFVPVLKQCECTHVSVNTNAALVTDEIAEFFRVNGMTAFVSLPCADPDICDFITSTKGSLERLSEGIRKLVAHKVSVTVNMVVSAINKDKVIETAKYAREMLGVKSFFASPVSKPVNAHDSFNKYMLSPDELDDLINTMLMVSKDMRADFSVSMPYCTFTTQEQSDAFSYRKHCTAGRFTYAVDYVGDVKACPRDSKVYGNILNEPFDEIWGRMDEWRNGSLLPAECKKCKSVSLCGGGCRLEGCASANERNALDTRARLDYAPLKFQKKPFEYPYAADQVFTINPHIHRVIEPIGVRINVGTEFLYITPKFDEFLKSRTETTLDEMKEVFDGATEDETKQIIDHLIHLYVFIAK